MPRPRKFSYADPKKRYTCCCGSDMKYSSLGTHLKSKKHTDYAGSRFPFVVERDVVFHFTPEGERRWAVSQQERAQERAQEIQSLSSVPPPPSPS